MSVVNVFRGQAKDSAYGEFMALLLIVTVCCSTILFVTIVMHSDQCDAVVIVSPVIYYIALLFYLSDVTILVVEPSYPTKPLFVQCRYIITILSCTLF